MSYRKFKADYLFTGIEMLAEDKILIAKPDGEIVSIVDEAEAGDEIEKFSGILTPGFVNAHCHLELSHMKGLIPEKTGLVDFVCKIIKERHFEEEEILEAIANTERQMRNSGIVAAGDICNNTLTLSIKLQRNIEYYNFIEVSGWFPGVAKSRFERSKLFYQDFLKNIPGTSIVPHAPYSVSDDLWNFITPYFQNKTISIHNQETIFEDEFFLDGTGDLVRMYELMNIDNSFFSPTKKSSLQSYFYRLAKAASVILVHNTFISQADIDYLKANRQSGQLLSFCICPNANLYIEDTSPPLDLLLQNDCSIVIGTDSLASNRSLNMLDEMRTIRQHLPYLPFMDLLQFCTLNGAKALQMEDRFGSFEKGKKPGIVLISNVDGEKLSYESASERIL